MLPKGGKDPVFIRGLGRFSNLLSLDSWGKHSISIIPHKEEITKVHKLISEGVKNKLRETKDGEYIITFSRPGKIKTRARGEVLLGPVKIMDKFGVSTELLREIEDNTEITIMLETYGGKSPSGFGTYKAARLAQIQIH